jgi:hypothetical protein
VLRSLGDHEHEIAQRLEAAGVRGSPGKMTDCALAVYLSAVVASDPRVRAVYVGNERVFIKGNRPSWWPWIGIPLSKPLRAFVAGFDKRAYPTLMRPLCEADRSTEPTLF